MSRKQQLLKMLNQYLDYDKQGSLKSRQHRRLILNKLVNDLYAAKVVPTSWHALTQEHIQRLVDFWRAKALQEATIMNYLACLRHFLTLIRHQLTGIDNQTLQLNKTRKTSKPTIESTALSAQIQEPLACMLFSLQTQFGLTLREALDLVPAIHILKEDIWVTRELSRNQKDRFIPIVTAEQVGLLTQLEQMTGLTQSLTKQFGEAHLRLAWRFALNQIGLPTNRSYHYLYAQARFKQLRSHQTKQESKRQVIAETTLSKTSTFWKIIDEQD